MSNLLVLDDIGQTIQEYINKNLIPNWASFVVQFAALVILMLYILLNIAIILMFKEIFYYEKHGLHPIWWPNFCH